MSGEFEAAGAMATAGLAAGVIEGREAPGAGEGACLNCGAALSGRYCSHCGQAAHAHRSLAHLFEEVVHGLFHFDTRAWRTLPLLAFRPGTLTRNYIYGKRARYISPLALFLFTIFLMFFVFAFVGANFVSVNATIDRADLVQGLDEARSELADAERELAASEGPGVEAAGAAIETAQAAVRRREASLARFDAVEASAASSTPGPEAPVAHEEARTWQDEISDAAKNGDIKVGTPFPALNERVLHSLENPDLALYKIQQAAYKFSFLLVPISLPFMWLLFLWKRGLTFYDHTVFVLYSLAFASIAFVFVALTSNVSWLAWVGGTVFGLGMPVHMFFHLKGAYALGWWSALWRALFLLLFAVLACSIFVSLIILLGLGG